MFFLLGAKKERRTAPNLILPGKIGPVILHVRREAGKHQIPAPCLPSVPSLMCSSCSLPWFVSSGHPQAPGAAEIQDSAPETSDGICRAPLGTVLLLPSLTSHPRHWWPCQGHLRPLSWGPAVPRAVPGAVALSEVTCTKPELLQLPGIPRRSSRSRTSPGSPGTSPTLPGHWF